MSWKWWNEELQKNGSSTEANIKLGEKNDRINIFGTLEPNQTQQPCKCLMKRLSKYGKKKKMWFCLAAYHLLFPSLAAAVKRTAHVSVACWCEAGMGWGKYEPYSQKQCGCDGQLYKHLILDFGSGLDIRVLRWSPSSGFTLGMEPA